jgi:hypothetical protein
MWLMAVAIPVQGMAAAVMPLCPPNHHADVQLHPPEHLAHGHGADSAQGVSMNHAAHHAAAAEPMDIEHHEGAGHAEPGLSGHGTLKCCSAACSMAAAMTPELVTWPRARAPAPLHPAAHFYRGVTPDGLERPPKLIRA